MIESRLRGVADCLKNGHNDFLACIHSYTVPSHMHLGLGHLTYFDQWEKANIMQADGWKVLAHWYLPYLATLYAPLTTTWRNPGKSTKWWDRHLWPRHCCHSANNQNIGKWHQPSSSSSHATFQRGHFISSNQQLIHQKPQVHEGGQQSGAKLGQTRRTAQMSNRIMS